MVASLLSEFCKIFSKVHSRQIGAQKQQCAIDIIASLVYKVQECWAEKKLVAALFMDIKGVFDHISRTKLVERMIELGIDGDII